MTTKITCKTRMKQHNTLYLCLWFKYLWLNLAKDKHVKRLNETAQVSDRALAWLHFISSNNKLFFRR